MRSPLPITLAVLIPTFTVVTCLAVLFMSKLDERRARTLQLASDPSVDLEEDIDVKAKMSDDVVSIHERVD